MTKQQFRKWISDPAVALRKLKKEEPDCIALYHLLLNEEDYERETGKSMSRFSERRKITTLLEWMYNTDNASLLDYYANQYDREFPLSIYSASIYGERESLHRACLTMARSRTKVYICYHCDWDAWMGDIETFEPEKFTPEVVIEKFIDGVDGFAASGFKLVRASKTKEEYPNYVTYSSGLKWIRREPKKYVVTW